VLGDSWSRDLAGTVTGVGMFSRKKKSYCSGYSILGRILGQIDPARCGR
jgi:hypothetical protein